MSLVRDSHPLIVSRLPYQELAQSIRDSQPEELLEVVEQRLSELRKEPGWLSVEDLESVARPGAKGLFRRVELDEECRQRVSAGRAEVESYLSNVGDDARRIYGVNTGFGAARKYDLDPEDCSRVSTNLLYSHAAGVGPALPVEIVRAMMLLRIKTFMQGLSGVRWEILETLCRMLNRGVIPFVPSKGSVGCSGDLCPLAHLFLVAIGAGSAWVVRPGDWDLSQSWNDDLDRRETWLRPGDRRKIWNRQPYALLSGREAMEVAEIPTVTLQAKEGLAVTNGASFSTASLVLGVFDAERLFHSANISGSLTHQAVSGLTRAFEAVVHSVRPHPGQILAGSELIRLLRGSRLINRSAFTEEAQDDYSIRAMPQVHGASWDAIAQARRVAEIEINSSNDNPLFFGCWSRRKTRGEEHRPGLFEIDTGNLPRALTRKTLDTTHCSAANFHGQPVAVALDLLKIALAELANIAERRTQLLLDPNHNRGLPGNLTLGAQGLHSGFTLLQYTSAALVSENKVFCHPSSVDSIPTSANAEDHNSMAANAARHLRQVVQNVADVLAIETICGLQALDIRSGLIGPLVRQSIDLEQTGEGETRPLDGRRIGWYIHRRYRRKAMVLFPEWAQWRAAQQDPGRKGEIKPGKLIREEDIPREGDWLNTRELALNGPSLAVWKLLRDPSGYNVPVIRHDGEMGQREEKSSLPGASIRMASFQEILPAEIIQRVGRAIRSGDVARAASSAVEKR